MKIILMPYADQLCICKNCKKKFTILKENQLDNYLQCSHCGSLKWDGKDEYDMKQEKKKKKL